MAPKTTKRKQTRRSNFKKKMADSVGVGYAADKALGPLEFFIDSAAQAGLSRRKNLKGKGSLTFRDRSGKFRTIHGPFVSDKLKKSKSEIYTELYGFGEDPLMIEAPKKKSKITMARSRKRKRTPARKLYKAKRRKKSTTLAKRIKAVEAVANQGVGTYDYRRRNGFRISVGQNGVNMTECGGYTTDNASQFMGSLEECIDALPVFDVNTPSVFQTIDFTTGSFQKKVRFAMNKTMCVVQNNYKTPCKVTLMLCYPKEDTSLSPDTALSTGLADKSTTLTKDSSMVSVYDSDLFKNLWKIKTKKSAILQNGEKLVLSNVGFGFDYDPQYVDEHGFDFQSRYGCHQYMLRLEGVVSHDATATGTFNSIGMGEAAVDVVSYRWHKIKYEAGRDLHRIEVEDNLSTMAAGAVTGLKKDTENASWTQGVAA